MTGQLRTNAPQQASLLYHLVSGRNKIGQKRKPKRVGGPEIDDEIELRRGVDGKIGRIPRVKRARERTELKNPLLVQKIALVVQKLALRSI